MKVTRVIVVLCIVTILISSCRNNTIRIGIIGDQFGAYNAEKAFDIMGIGVLQLKEKSPDIVLHVGDMLESQIGINNFDNYKKNYNTAMTIMSSFECPWLLAVGDHDVAPEGFQALSKDRSRETWFMNLIQTSQLPIQDKPYYSYTYKGYHFIVLYSMENLHTDPRWGSIFLNKINNEQLLWLKKDLKANNKNLGVIVLVHHPHWYVWQNWQPVHELLKEYKTHAVIAGHFHYDQDEGEVDGIRYLVMGSSGGVIKETDQHTASQEIAMLTLSKKGIEKIELNEIGTGIDLEWTPRISMDRIQAISCMLDNLWQDETLYSENGKVYSLNANGEYNIAEKINIESLVNPIDLPIKLHISISKDIYSNPLWLLDGKEISKDTMTFEPAFRSGWANYSSVGNWFGPSSIWQANIDNSKANEKENLELKVYVSFEDSRKREIHKTVNYYIKKK